MRTDQGSAHGFFELSHRKEHGDEATDDQIVDAGLHIAHAVRDGAGRDDCKVVTDFLVVEDALTGGVNPTLVQRLAGMLADRMAIRQGLENFLGGRHVIFREILRVGTRVGEGLVVLVETLGGREGSLRREAETAVTFALQCG